ncbi:MAG: CBS domain-containing protein [Planctomycetes bacterium]|nr:CBS domain-containing protein [Planctomycetota bacterium]MBI3833714.1 CBS domain-containing protein [Planctomycetota bacterium]
MQIINYATCPVRTAKATDTIDKAITLMEEFGIHHVVAVRDDVPVGMISDRDILISTGWMLAVERMATIPPGGRAHLVGPSRIEQIMSSPVKCVSLDDDARQVARIMLEHRFGALPILRNGKLAAIVSQTDLLRWLGELAPHDESIRQMLDRQVKSVMRAHVFSVPPEAPLSDVVQLFHKHHIHHVLVAKGVELRGIISDRDVRRALGWSSIRDMQEDAVALGVRDPGTAKDVMKEKVITAAPADTLRSVLQKMLDRKIHAIPVTVDGRLSGIITGTDFLREIAHQETL